MGGFQNRPPREICNFCRPELHEKKFLDSLRGRDAEDLRGILLERYANPAYFSGDEALLAAAESLYEHMNIREIGEKDGLRYYLCWFNAEEYLSLLGQPGTGSEYPDEYPDEYQELMAGNEKRAVHRSVPGCRGRGDDG